MGGATIRIQYPIQLNIFNEDIFIEVNEGGPCIPRLQRLRPKRRHGVTVVLSKRTCGPASNVRDVPIVFISFLRPAYTRIIYKISLLFFFFYYMLSFLFLFLAKFLCRKLLPLNNNKIEFDCLNRIFFSLHFYFTNAIPRVPAPGSRP